MTPSPLLLVTHALNALLMIAMPVALAIYLTRRFKTGWRLWGIGAATFILSQVGHIPFNAALTLVFERGLLPVPPKSWQLLFNAIVLGLSAGLWEELSRYAAFRWWVKDARSWRNAVLLGAGHGGAEAILLGALVLLTYFSMVMAANMDLAASVPADQLDLARQQISTYWGAPWPMSLLGALERMLTIPVQITFSVLVLQTFVRRQWFWVWLAVLWHAVIDAAAVYTHATWGVIPAEAGVALAALLSLGMLFALRQPEPEAEAEEPIPPPLPGAEFLPPPVEENAENLDNTRYSGD